MTESSAPLISYSVTKTYDQRGLLNFPPSVVGVLFPSFPYQLGLLCLLTRLGSLLLFNLLQASQQRVDLHLDLSQLPFNSL